MCNFEPGLINSIRVNCKDDMIDSCFYHYMKLFWEYAKKLGLCKKKILKIIKYLYLLLKLSRI